MPTRSDNYANIVKLIDENRVQQLVEEIKANESATLADLLIFSIENQHLLPYFVISLYSRNNDSGHVQSTLGELLIHSINFVEGSFATASNHFHNAVKYEPLNQNYLELFAFHMVRPDSDIHWFERYEIEEVVENIQNQELKTRLKGKLEKK